MKEIPDPTYPKLRLLKFRWEQVQDSVIEFSNGLCILHGKTQAERTVVLRLVRYALGGNANRIDDEDMKKSTSVKLRFEANGELVDITRSCQDTNERVTVQEIGGGDGPSPPDRISVDRLSRYLIDKLGMPVVNMSRTRQGQPVEVPLSFKDYTRAIFVDRDISYTDILGGLPDSNRNEVIKVMIGLTTREIAETENRRRFLETQKRHLEQRVATIRDFLKHLDVPTLQEIQLAHQEVSNRLAAIDEEELASRQRVRNAAAESSTDNGESLYDKHRDELIASRQRLDEFKREILNLTHYQQEKVDLRAQLEAEVNRLNRHLSSQHVISTFTFSLCPRCNQPIEEEMRRREEEDLCMLCARPFSTNVQDSKSWEKVLRDTKQTIKEVDELLEHYKDRKEHLQREAAALEGDILRVERQLWRETEKYVSPLIEEMRLKAAERTRLERELSQLEYQERQRQYAIHLEEVELPEEVKKLEEVTWELERLRQALGSESERYNAFLHHFRRFLRGVNLDRNFEDATWVPDEQLPYINGQPVKKAFTGPDLAVAVLGFHYALLAMSVVPPKVVTNHPKLLIIDEPEQQKMGKERYQQVMGLFGGLAMEYQNQVQIIIATATEDVPDRFEQYAIEL
jgi:hypothetical protein